MLAVFDFIKNVLNDSKNYVEYDKIEAIRNILKRDNRKISVEDPVIPKSNLSRSMSNNKMCEYMLERFKFTFLYFNKSLLV